MDPRARASNDTSGPAAGELSIALFFDLENLIRGLRESKHGAFEARLIIDRLLEKGKVLIKRAYGDWTHLSKYKVPLHELGAELIEIPKREVSGKNSADIRMVVDAMEICFAKEHVDTFALASGDSDFFPLASKLREHDKTVIGIGVKGSTSRILVENCDEFIFYEDLVREVPRSQGTTKFEALPDKKREVFMLLLSSIQALLRENQEVLWSSLVKQTMKRKLSSFDESYYGYSTFTKLLEDARRHGLIELQKDDRSNSLIVLEAETGR
jgi:uncharacterized protein (TIGR00288 family)